MTNYRTRHGLGLRAARRRPQPHRQPQRRFSARLAAAFGALILGVLALVAPAPAAWAADNGAWGITPTPTAVDHGASREYFILDGSPGQTLKDSATISNHTAAPLAFYVYPAAAYNTNAGGGLAFQLRNQRPADIGAWVRMARTSVTVAPGKSVVIHFTLTIPANASPGDHVGAILAEDSQPIVQKSNGNIRIGARYRVGARIYLQVNGRMRAAMSVSGLHVHQSAPVISWLGGSNRTTITYTLTNQGNVILNPKTALSADGLIGGSTQIQAGTALPQLLPGNSTQISVVWPNAPQLDRVTVHLAASGTPGELTANQNVSYLAYSWVTLLLIVLLAALLLAGLALLVRRQSRRRPDEDGDDGDRGDGEDEGQDGPTGDDDEALSTPELTS